MGVATGCGCKEVYIDFLILLIPTPLVSVLFCSFLNEYRKSTYQELDQIPPGKKSPA